MDSNEQTILINFYNSLTSNGSVNWDLTTDLCGQTGIVCDSSNPKRVVQLYFLFCYYSFFFFFLFFKKTLSEVITEMK